jgi:DNA polymerase subunit Cdc27
MLGAEALSTAHELYIQRYRDKIQDKTFHQFVTPISFNNAVTASKTIPIILPSNAIKQRVGSKFCTPEFENDSEQIDIHKGTKAGGRMSITDNANKQIHKSHTMATTAEGYFKNSAQKKSSKSNVTMEKICGNISKMNTIFGARESTSGQEKGDNDDEVGKENTDLQQSQEFKITHDNKKSSVSTKASSTVVRNTVGNADDFTGDADDDDDDDKSQGAEGVDDVDGLEEQSESMKDDNGGAIKYCSKKHIQLANSIHRANKMVYKPCETNYNSEVLETVVNDRRLEKSTKINTSSRAMDSFVVGTSCDVVVTKVKENGARSRRLQKILQEEEFLDSKGYLRTEIKEKWIETVSDEEDENNNNINTMEITQIVGNSPSKSKPININARHVLTKELVDGKKKAGSNLQKQSSKKFQAGNKNNLKQGNLMGFWSKK